MCYRYYEMDRNERGFRAPVLYIIDEEALGDSNQALLMHATFETFGVFVLVDGDSNLLLLIPAT